MTLRKITIDNSVRYIPKSEQTKESDIKLKTGRKKLVFFLGNKTKIVQGITKNSLQT